MQELVSKILSHLSKNTLIILVVLFGGTSMTLWYEYSKYSPKAITERQDDIMNFSVSQAKIFYAADSSLKVTISEIANDQLLMRIQLDTIVNYQTPALINRVNMMSIFYRKFYKQNINEKPVSQSESMMNLQPIQPKYEQTLTLINDIGLSFAPGDTGKVKKKYL